MSCYFGVVLLLQKGEYAMNGKFVHALVCLKKLGSAMVIFAEAGLKAAALFES